MGLAGSIDWALLTTLIEQYGKAIGIAVTLLIGLVTLAGWIFKHYHTTVLDRMLAERVAEVQKQKEFYEIGTAALRQAEQELKRQREAIETREQALNNVRNAFNGKEHELWCTHPAPNSTDNDPGGSRKPIILVANLKGGVGKTTLVANLAAYFSSVGKRVLLVDVDYQGSLSNMLLSADGSQQVPAGIKDVLASPGEAPPSRQAAAYSFVNVLKGSAIVPARYDFASFESRLMIEYLLGESEDDGRYRLLGWLSEQMSAGQFDLALIDAPPRLTTGTINGFCASTHLLVPTVYDTLSAEAIGTFLHGAKHLKKRLNPGIDLLGIVGMLTQQQTGLVAREQTAKQRAAEEVSRAWSPNHHFFDRHIPRRAAISQAAGRDMAYLSDPEIKGFFDELGQELSKRLGWNDRVVQMPSADRGERMPRFITGMMRTTQAEGAVHQ
jgi:cellulose biosynthesis protein BcsQ